MISFKIAPYMVACLQLIEKIILIPNNFSGGHIKRSNSDKETITKACSKFSQSHQQQC